MITDINQNHYEALHNLINLRLYPDCELRLAQKDECRYHDVDVTWTRIGNPYGYSRDASTYRYSITGRDFHVSLLAIWSDQDCATAELLNIVIGPDSDEARESLREWLDSIVAITVPRDARSTGLFA